MHSAQRLVMYSSWPAALAVLYDMRENFRDNALVIYDDLSVRFSGMVKIIHFAS